ncbi:MAG TPA: vWA domain-containing protein [Bdellovibrionota bacterium]|nr:vWA domain-containing protein [Bdellovibrionota bacterium]
MSRFNLPVFFIALCVSSSCARVDEFDFFVSDASKLFVPSCSDSGSETEVVPLVANGGSARASNVVFVLDTSGSMANEIAQVRSNMEQFVNSVKSTLPAASTRFAVIGERQNSTDVLPAPPYVKNGSYNGVFWHFYEIGSTDKMQKLMRSYGMTEFQSGGTTRSLNSSFPAIPGVNFAAACSTAGSLFNCDALNHVVVVTDDIERLPNVTGQDATRTAFMTSFGAHLSKNRNTFKLHAIHAKQASTCSVAAYGKIYEDIAAATGSLSVDVCTTNWTPVFNALKNNIVASSGAVHFGKCASPTRSVSSVRVRWSGGEVALAASDYIYTNPAELGTRPSIYVSPQTLQSKGVPIDGTPLSLVIETSY